MKFLSSIPSTVLLVAVLAWTLASGPVTRAADATGTLTGFVSNPATGNMLEGARVGRAEGVTY